GRGTGGGDGQRGRGGGRDVNRAPAPLAAGAAWSAASRLVAAGGLRPEDCGSAGAPARGRADRPARRSGPPRCVSPLDSRLVHGFAGRGRERRLAEPRVAWSGSLRRG